MLTIGANVYGLPVSTTPVLSSDVAGTMLTNRSGVQLLSLASAKQRRRASRRGPYLCP